METQRLISLDVFRGLTVAFMLLVNNPGSWAHIYGPLRHASWHGWTPTDLVFPFFLFAVGVSISLSFRRSFGAGLTTIGLVRKVVLRTGIIFALGWFLNAFPYDDLANVRFWGVLQRISICYLIAGLTVAIVPGNRGRLAVVVVLIASYEFLMRWPLLPEWGGGSFALVDNFARWVDLQWPGPMRLAPGGQVPFEPEGLVSSLTASAGCLLGFFAGEILGQATALSSRLKHLALGGFFSVLAGLLLSLAEPINKQLWTVSYTLLMTGQAAVVLAGCGWLMDLRGWVKGTQPFLVFGGNALLAFVGTGLVARIIIRIDWPGTNTSIKTMIYREGLLPWLGALNASLAYALITVFVWWFGLWLLHKRQIFIKI